MNLKITFKKYTTLIQRGFTLDIIYLLKMIQENFNVKTLCQDTPKLSLLCQTILRRQLITNEYKLTIEGKELLAFFDISSRETIAKIKSDDNVFETWWKAYPGTDTFTYKNKSFTGTRGLRVKKDECLLKFNKIIGEGEYTLEEMIKALEFEVLQKKENSIKTDINKLTFMQNSLTYLTQRTFDPFIELIKEGQKLVVEPTKVTGGTDI